MEENELVGRNLQSITSRIQKIRQRIQQETSLASLSVGVSTSQMQVCQIEKRNAQENPYRCNPSLLSPKWIEFADWNNYSDWRKLSLL